MNARGYSLLELLIALALLGFIAIAIAGGIRFGARAWETSDASVDALERVQGAQNLLRVLLQQATPRDIDPGVVDPDLFRGTAERLAFTAAAPAAFASGGLTHFDLRIETVAGGKRLVLSWQGVNGAPQSQAIVGGARQLSFAYGVLDQNGRLGWTEDWTQQSGAPALVMVRAAFADGSKARWPDLIVRTRITRDPMCVYDTDAQSCRHG